MVQLYTHTELRSEKIIKYVYKLLLVYIFIKRDFLAYV